MMEIRGNIRENILECIGNTPLIKLNRIGKDLKCTLLVKCEFLNPGGSVKDRPAREMLLRHFQQVLSRGEKETGALIAPSSGNMGIGLSMMAAVLGCNNMHITIPDKMSKEKISVLKALGATVHLTPEECSYDHPLSLISQANILKEELQGTIMNQYENPANPECHYQTAAEILADCPQVSAVVAGAGSGGTLVGIARKMDPSVKIIGVDPVGSILADPEHLRPMSYAVEGIGYDFIPKTLDRSLVNMWEQVHDRDAFAMARRLIREEGLLIGGSSGAAVMGALQAIEHEPSLNQADKFIVIILPDSIRNYLDKFVSDDWMTIKYYKPSMQVQEVDPRIERVLKGPLRSIRRTPDLYDKVNGIMEFPMIVTSLYEQHEPDEVEVVGLINPAQMFKAQMQQSQQRQLTLEKNFCLIREGEGSLEDLIKLASTGYPIIVKRNGNFYIVDLEKLLKFSK